MITKPDKLTIQTDDLNQIKLLCGLTGDKFFSMLDKHWFVQDYVVDSYPGRYRGTFNLMAVVTIQPDSQELPIPELWVPKELLVRIKNHFQEGDPNNARYSHLKTVDDLAAAFVAKCNEAHEQGTQIYKDICEVLK